MSLYYHSVGNFVTQHELILINTRDLFYHRREGFNKNILHRIEW